MKKHIPVVKPYLPDKKKYIKYLNRIWKESWLTNFGPIHNEYINSAKNYLGVNYVYPFLNGTTSLEATISILGIKGKEIITTPFTFAATITSIINSGNIPIFIDVNINDGNIDINKIEEKITKNTAAILPVHIYGNPVDIEKIEIIAKKYDLYTIYDSAHMFGVTINNIGIGNFGDVSVFSTHATKVFHTIEGGLITFNNPEIFRISKLFSNFGFNEEYDVIYPGTNGKMNEFQASMGLCILDDLDLIISKRKNVFEFYKKYLPNDIIFTKYDNKNIHYNYIYMIIKHPNRDKIKNDLLVKNVSSRPYFYPICSEFTLIKKLYGNIEMPIALNLSKEVLAIPMYSELTENDVEYISKIIIKNI